MFEIMLSTAVGLFIGLLFTALKLPIPAPPVLSGIMGIVGIYAGNQIYLKILEMLQ